MNQGQGTGGGSLTRFTQTEIMDKFRRLAAELPELEPHTQSQRIAILWDEIGCRREILRTIESGVHDLWLPISKACLPLSLEPGAFRRLQKKQPLLLSDTFTVIDSSQWPGEHANLCAGAISWKNVPNTVDAQRILGEGGFGSVTEVKCANDRVYALKIIRRKSDRKEAQEQMNYVKMELDVLRRIDHCHYIRLVGSYTEPRHIGILMDPVADCNLEQFLDEFEAGQRSESLLAGFFGCLATALAQLHFKWSIRHKDIKPQNILVLVEQKNILLTDFGLSLDWSETGYTTTNQEQLRSPIYCAPEVAKDKPRNSMSDIWSLGCVFLEMAAVLKGKRRSFVREILASQGSPKYWDCPKGIEKIIDELSRDNSRWGNEPLTWAKTMLKKKKEDRPTSRQLRHTILQAKGDHGQPFCGCCCQTDTSPGIEEEEEEENEEEYDKMTMSVTAGRDQANNSAMAATAAAASSATASIKPLGARVHDPMVLTWGDVQMLRCPQSPDNWISADTAAHFNLEVHDVGETKSFVLGAFPLESSSSATVTWIEDDATKTHRSDFLVTQAGVPVPFQLLVGGPSIQ